MEEFRPDRSLSWWDAEGSKALSARLSDRLTKRCKGEAGVMLTLTYNREAWDCPRDLYRASSDERHVRRFIEGLGAYLGESLKGRWICKLEFQSGGWVHWHLILLGVRFIDHHALSELWGMGHVWVSRMSKARVQYVCKYVAKGGQVPAWVYGEPSGSIKVIRTSPGFWERPEDDDDEDDDDEDDEFDAEPADGVEVRDEDRPMRIVGVYISIGDRLNNAREHCTVRTADGLYHRVWVRAWEVVQMVLSAGGGLRAGSTRGWVGFVARDAWCSLRDLRALEAKAARAAAAAGPRGFHLIQETNPPERAVPVWLDEYMEWALDDREGIAA